MRLFSLAVSVIALFTSGALMASTPVAKPVQSPQASKAAKPSKVSKTKAAKPAEPQEPTELDEERMAVAPRVLAGDVKCEFGHQIRIDPHPDLAGRFVLKHRGVNHLLTPQPTTTGVIRLENKHTGFLWLQVPIKSMLMDTKKGQRLVDNCLHPEQEIEVEAMRQSSAPAQ